MNKQELHGKQNIDSAEATKNMHGIQTEEGCSSLAISEVSFELAIYIASSILHIARKQSSLVQLLVFFKFNNMITIIVRIHLQLKGSCIWQE